MTRQYVVWLDEKDNVVGKPAPFQTFDDVDWAKCPKGGKCIVKGTSTWLCSRYQLSYKLFEKWERLEREKSDG